MRWWDGSQWTAHYQPGSEASSQPSSLHLWWALSPVYSCGLVTFIPALHAAMKLQRRDLWLWAIGLIFSNVVLLVVIGGTPSNADGTNTPVQTVGVVLVLLLMAMGTVHAFRVRDEVFTTSTAPRQRAGGRGATRADLSLDPAVANSLTARKRRVEVQQLCAEDPALARDLLVGRPDLTRQYYDGGLVDINHVPAQVLVSHLGLSEEESRGVIEAREYVGAFDTVDDLVNLAGLPPRTLDSIRDRIVAL
jgi:DNA uptake protein ComE-like DNA-binding protein